MVAMVEEGGGGGGGEWVLRSGGNGSVHRKNAVAVTGCYSQRGIVLRCADGEADA